MPFYLVFLRNARSLTFLVGFVAVAGTLQASTIASFTATNISGYTSGNIGQITLTNINADEVEVNVNLGPDVFADTGAGGGGLFDFNIVSTKPIALASGTSIQFTSLKTPTPSVTLHLSGANTFGSGAFGNPKPTFSDSITCAACSGTSQEISSITFYLTDTKANGTLSSSDFMTDSTGKYYFGGDIGIRSGDTFKTGVAVSTVSTDPVAPEPMTAWLVAPLLLAFAGRAFLNRSNGLA